MSYLVPRYGSGIARRGDRPHFLILSVHGHAARFHLVAVRSKAALIRGVQESLPVLAFNSSGPDSFILKNNAVYLKLPFTCVSSLRTGAARAGVGGDAAWVVGSHPAARGGDRGPQAAGGPGWRSLLRPPPPSCSGIPLGLESGGLAASVFVGRGQHCSATTPH